MQSLVPLLRRFLGWFNWPLVFTIVTIILLRHYGFPSLPVVHNKIEVAKIVLEYLRALLSWPVITLILVLFFLKSYQQALAQFLGRITKGNIWGAEFQAHITPTQQRQEIAAVDNANDSVVNGDLISLKAVAFKGIALPQDTAQITTLAEKFKRDVNQDPVAMCRMFLQTVEAVQFERIYQLILQSQIDLLVYLARQKESGASEESLRPYYERYTQHNFPVNYEFPNFLGFLMDVHFVLKQTDERITVYRISPRGLSFLSYLHVLPHLPKQY